MQKRETEVKKHYVKNKEEDKNRWGHLLSGHRFCYVSKIFEQKERFSEISIPDPRDPRLLIDAPVVLYYTGQHINCAICHETAHLHKDCPERPKRRCFSCGEEGHSKINCPQRAQIRCYNCQDFGHIARNCLSTREEVPLTRRQVNASNVANKTPKNSHQQRKQQTDLEATPNPLKWVEDLIDRAITPSSEPHSPELLEKVESYLQTKRQEMQSVQAEAEKTPEPSPAADPVDKSLAVHGSKPKKQTTLTGEKYEQKQSNENKNKGKEDKKKKSKRKNAMSPTPEELKSSSKKERRNSPGLSPPPSSEEEWG